MVVGSNHIVSAAHCFVKLDGDYSSLKLGKGTLGNPMSDITINNLTVHPKYSGIKYVGETGYENRVFYDIAVLTTKEKLDSLRPVSIVNSKYLKSGNEVILAGYGAYKEKDNGSLRNLTRVSTTVDYVSGRFKEIQLTINQKGACYGDSGGPLYIKHPTKNCLGVAGTVTGHSRGSIYQCEDGGGTITDISVYQGWMKCSFEEDGYPLDYLENDGSESDCRQ